MKDEVASPRDHDTPGMMGAMSPTAESAPGSSGQRGSMMGPARTRRRRFGRFYDSVIEDVMGEFSSYFILANASERLAITDRDHFCLDP